MGSIEDQLVSKIFFLKIQIAEKKIDAENLIKDFKCLKKFENGMVFSAKKQETGFFSGDRDYFMTEKELDEAIKNKTHKSPKKKKRNIYKLEEATKILKKISLVLNKKSMDSYNAKKFKEASKEFENTFYLIALNPNMKPDTSLMYNKVLSELKFDKNKALETYKWLIKNSYTGIKTVYEAEDEKGEKVRFNNLNEMNLYVKTGKYKNPNTKKLKSVLPSLYKETISLLMKMEKYTEGEKLALEAKSKYPQDNDLTLYIGDIYYKQGKKEEFVKILEEAIEKDPKNKLLYLNTAIVFQELKQKNKSEEYYKKAIEIDPNYRDAYYNLAVLILSEEQEINDKISKLGWNRKAKRTAKKLEKQKKELYKKSIIYLEKAFELGKKNDLNLISTMKGIYYQLEDTPKFKKMKELEEKFKK